MAVRMARLPNTSLVRRQLTSTRMGGYRACLNRPMIRR